MSEAELRQAIEIDSQLAIHAIIWPGFLEVTQQADLLQPV